MCWGHLIVHEVENALDVPSHVSDDEVVFTNEVLRVVVLERICTYDNRGEGGKNVGCGSKARF